MNVYLVILLRAIHIFAGILWVGSAIFFLFFIEPTIKSFGPSGQQFMQHLVSRQRYPQFMGMVSLLTVLAGGALLWISSGGLRGGYFRSGPGIGFTIGSVVGIAVFLMGIFLMSPIGKRMGELGQEIGRSGGPPTTAQAAELQSLDQRLAKLERIDFVLLSVSLLTMATARFWVF